MVEEVGAICRDFGRESFCNTEVTSYAHIHIVPCALTQGSVGRHGRSAPIDVRYESAGIARIGYHTPSKSVNVVLEESIGPRCNLAPRGQSDSSFSVVPTLQRFWDLESLSRDDIRKGIKRAITSTAKEQRDTTLERS